MGNAKGHHAVSSMLSYKIRHGDVSSHIFCRSYNNAYHIAKPQGADELAGGSWRDKLQSLCGRFASSRRPFQRLPKMSPRCGSYSPGGLAASARSNVGSSMVAGCILSQNSPSRPRLLSHHQTTNADFCTAPADPDADWLVYTGIRVSRQSTGRQAHCHGYGEMKDQSPPFLCELKAIRAPSVLPNGEASGWGHDS